MIRIFLFSLIIATLYISCNSYKRFQQTNPTPINAKRVMFIILPIKEVGLPLGSFFAVCDSIFKKNNIAKMAVALKVKDFNGAIPKENVIMKPLIEFQPDCLIFFAPDKFERNQGLNFVRYRTFMMSIEPADYLLLDHAEDYNKMNPIYINTVKLTAIRSMERDRKNGIDAAKNFLKELKKHLSNLQ